MGLTASGIWYPDGNYTVNPRVIAAAQASNLETVIQNERNHFGHVDYVSTAARDAAYTAIGGPISGDQCTVLGVPWHYTGGAWKNFKTADTNPSTQGSLGISGALTTTTSNLTTLQSITAVDYPRVLQVTAYGVLSALAGAYATIQLALNGTVVTFIRLPIINVTGSGTFQSLIAAGATASWQVFASTNTSTATLVADNRFCRVSWWLQSA